MDANHCGVSPGARTALQPARVDLSGAQGHTPPEANRTLTVISAPPPYVALTGRRARLAR